MLIVLVCFRLLLLRPFLLRSGNRQGRAYAWQNFSKLVCSVANKPAQEAADAAPVSQVLRSFRPSHMVAEDGRRRYQIVACRLHPCSTVRPAAVMEVFRASYKKKGGYISAKAVDEELPATFAGAIRILLLEPHKHNADGSARYVATCLSEAVSLDPHDDLGVVLYQLPDCHLRITEHRQYLEVEVSKAASDGMKAGSQIIQGRFD